MISKTVISAGAAAIITQQHPQEVALPKIPVEKAKRILNGIFTILTSANHFDELAHCYRDVVTDIEDLTIAVEDFKTKETTAILDGIMHVGDFLVNLPKSTQDCTHMQDDLHRLVDWAKGFKDPKLIMNEVWTNLTTNFAHIIHMLDLFNMSIISEEPFKWEIAGRFVGYIMVDILGPVPNGGKMGVDPETIELTNW